MGEKRWFRLDDRELLSAEPVQPDRRLAPDDAATDDRDAVGYLAEVGGVPRGPRSGLAQAGDRRYRGRGTGRDYDGLPGMEPAHGGLRRRDLDRLLAGQPAGASDHVDPVRPLNLLGVVVIVDKAVAPAQCEHWTSSSSDSTITAVRRPSLIAYCAAFSPARGHLRSLRHPKHPRRLWRVLTCRPLTGTAGG